MLGLQNILSFRWSNARRAILNAFDGSAITTITVVSSVPIDLEELYVTLAANSTHGLLVDTSAAPGSNT